MSEKHLDDRLRTALATRDIGEFEAADFERLRQLARGGSGYRIKDRP